MSWSGWAHPWGSDGLLMPVGLYATDVLEMARQFVQLAGLGRRQRWSQKLGCLSFRPEPGGHGCRGQEQGLHPSILLQAMRSTASWKSMPQQACGMPWILPGIKPYPLQAGGEVGCGLRTIFRFWRRSWLWTHFLFRLGGGILLRPHLSSC